MMMMTMMELMMMVKTYSNVLQNVFLVISLEDDDDDGDGIDDEDEDLDGDGIANKGNH